MIERVLPAMIGAVGGTDAGTIVLLVLAGVVLGGLLIRAPLQDRRPALQGRRDQAFVTVFAALVVAFAVAATIALSNDESASRAPSQPRVFAFHLDGSTLGQDFAVSISTRQGTCDRPADVTAVISPTRDAGLPRRGGGGATIVISDQHLVGVPVVEQAGNEVAVPQEGMAVPAGQRVAIVKREADGRGMRLRIQVADWERTSRKARPPSLIVRYRTDAAVERTSSSCWVVLPVVRGDLVTRATKGVVLEEGAGPPIRKDDRRRRSPRPGSAVVGVSELVASADGHVVSAGESQPAPQVTSQFNPPRWTCAFTPEPDDASSPSTNRALDARHFRINSLEQPTCAAAAVVTDTQAATSASRSMFLAGLVIAVGLSLLVGVLTADFPERLRDKKSAGADRAGDEHEPEQHGEDQSVADTSGRSQPAAPADAQKSSAAEQPSSDLEPTLNANPESNTADPPNSAQGPESTAGPGENELDTTSET